MNKRSYRLVFDHTRGMRVATAEHVRGERKAASGSTRGRRRTPRRAGPMAAAGLGMALLGAVPALAAPPVPRANTFLPPGQAALPVRSTDPGRLAGDVGRFNITNPDPSKLLITQQDAKAIINWDSFNVGSGNSVQFVQPDKGSTLNRIWDANPSVIQGRISANGEVILQNGNGVIFGPTARVETARFVATALQISNEVYRTGLRGITDGGAALVGDQDNGFVSIERGAEIRAAAGGDVLVFAPRVINEGRIETPSGQTVLGAGQTVYLAASADPKQRGLIVGIKPFATSDTELNTVTQAEAREYKTVDGQTVADSTPDSTAGVVRRVNEIVAEKGSINLVALAVRQNGTLRATTAVKGQNGVILLQGQLDVNPLSEQTVNGTFVSVPQPTRLGSVTFGAESVTEVMPSADKTETQTDAETFNRSKIRVEGEKILVKGGAVVRAPSGSIEMLASNQADQSVVFDPASFNLSDHSNDPSRIVVEAGATISAAGLRDVALPMSRNQGSGRLFQIELADSPVQRNGVLYREEIFFDARNPVKVANVTGLLAGVARTAEELSTTGGSVSLLSDGAVVLDRDATLNVSGGSVRYDAGTLKISLLRSGSTWVPIGSASADVRYDELGNSKARTDAGSAIVKTIQVPGYVEGKDAGSATIAGRRTYIGGDVEAGVVLGPYQDGRGSATAPQAGELVVGRQRITDSAQAAIQVTAGASGARPDAFLAQPELASVDDLPATTVLSADALRTGGVGRLTLYAADQVALDRGAHLDLGVGGRLTIEAGSAVIDGQVRAAGGGLRISTRIEGEGAHDISLGSDAVLDVSGLWTDDRRLAVGAGNGPAPRVSVDGGSIALSSAGSLAAEAGAVLEVSGGAHRAASTRQGKAGSIALSINVGADPTQPLPGGLSLWNAEMNGFDFRSGGSLSVAGLPRLTLGGTLAEDRRFDSDFFNEHGFGKIRLSTLGDATIASGFDLTLGLLNYKLAASRDAGGRFASIGTPDDPTQRSAISLTVDASTAPSIDSAAPLRGSSLTMEAGSRIATGPGGSLTFQARRNLTVAGELAAPGGAINLSVLGQRGGSAPGGVFDDKIGFLEDQALWLASSARLSVAGTTVTTRDVSGRPVGKVYGGGTVNLTASRGYVVAEAGSTIDLRGAEATLQTNGALTPQRVSRSAGSLNLSTPEGFVFDSEVLAQAPGAEADGGTLSVSVTLGGLDRLSAGTAYPTTPRSIELRGEAASGPSTIRPGDDLNAALGNGHGLLSADRIRDAGFSQVSLKADDRIELAGTVELALPRSVVLDSAAIAAAPGAHARIVAPYVSIGDRRTGDRLAFEATPAAQSGDGQLTVDAATIDIFGASALTGWQAATLNATLDEAGGGTRRDGEIRLIGTTRGLSDTATGTLAFAGDLRLKAGQLYATTLSQFDVAGSAGDSRLETLPPEGGSASGTPLSALASLKLTADEIVHGGVIRQPFGNISIQADRLELGAGSITSVAGEGATIPVGTTVNGRTWQYRPDGLYGADGSAKSVDAVQNLDIRTLSSLPTDKSIVVNGKQLSVDAAAQLSAAGGGDLQAWEFVAGVGGSKDYLTTAGLYAVVPSYTGAFAPYDAEVANSSTGSRPAPGAYIDITMSGSGLAPGRYTLLPARYALLPGAYLVSLAVDQGKSGQQTAIQRDDGSTIVTGSFGSLGSFSASDGGTRILVEPAETFLAKSRLDRTSINDFLSAGAARLDKPEPALPTDGGRIAFRAEQAFDWSALVDLGNRSKGKRGELDIAVQGGRSVVVDDLSQASASLPDDTSLVSAGAIAASNAGSVLIGGLRSGSGGVVTLQTVNRSVDVLSTATALEAGELLLNATERVSVADGAQLRATGAPDSTAGTLALSGDSALLSVSNRTSTTLTRSYAPGGTVGATGSVAIGAGARLEGAAVRLAATAGLDVSQQATIETDNLALSAGRLAIGTPTAPTDATVLEGRLLQSIQGIGSLELGSARGIDVYGAQDIHADHLVLDTPNLRGIGSAGDVVRFSAGRVELRNSSSSSADPSKTGSGQVVITAASASGEGLLTIGQSAQTGDGSVFLGFADARLISTGDAVFSGAGRLATQLDASLSAARITATTGSDHGLASGGSLRLAREADGAARDDHIGLGASLSFSGQQVEQAGWVQASGGRLAFRATSDAAGRPALSFASGSITSVAGPSLEAAEDWTVYGGAGSIRAVADAGSVRLAGAIDVSAKGTADAGTLQIVAAGVDGGVDLVDGASLLGSGGDGHRQGRVGIDAGRLLRNGVSTEHLDDLATALDRGGFGDAVAVRVRQGNLRLDDATLRARQVTLTADGGNLAVGGVIDARAASGGVVRLFARDDATLSGSIDARSTRIGANGGDVLVASAQGQVRLAETARIDASGDDAADGRIVLRAARDTAAGTVNVSVAPGFDTQRLAAGEIDVEAVERFTGFTSLKTGATSGAALGQTAIRNANQLFADNAPGWWAGAGLAGDARAHLRPSAEIVAAGNFTVTNDWNLWEESRPGGEPGFLTIRAAGNLILNGSISDGFATATRATAATPTEIKTGDAWSFRFVAGADTSSADPMNTVAGAEADLSVASGKLVRTTSGSIDMAAARDLRLSDGTAAAQAVVYVAGKPSTQNLGLVLSGSNWEAQFTSHGGNLDLRAGRDVVGAPTTQQFGAWFYHTGSEGQTASAWWSGFDAFRQGVGSFGGGNVSIEAGRDVLNLGVVAPTSALAGLPDGVATLQPTVENGGDIEVRAGRDIAGGVYFLGRGDGLLSAARDVTVGGTSNATARPALAPVLGLMDGHWEIQAGESASLAATYNPTMLPSANRTQRIGDPDAGLFFTYGADSSLAVSALAGSVSFQADLPVVSGKPGIAQYWASLASSGPAAEQILWAPKFLDPVSVLPPELSVQALGGGLEMRLPTASRGLTLYPSASGKLSFYARDDITFQANSGTAALYLGDGDPSKLPLPSSPVPVDRGNIDRFDTGTFDAPTTAAAVPFGTLHAGDAEPVRITAAEGSIELARSAGQGTVLLVFPKRAELSAGQDVLNLNMVLQQDKATDVSTVRAGGSFIELPAASASRIVVAGPGELRIEAGRQLDLGSSQGIETVGNQYNPALPSQGASLTLAAGTRAALDGDTLLRNYLSQEVPGDTVAQRAAAFADAYFRSLGQDPSSLDAAGLETRATLIQRYGSFLAIQGTGNAATVQARRDSLVRFVREVLGQPPLPDADLPAAFDTAWAQFRQLPSARQVGFATGLLAQAFGEAYFAEGRPYAELWQRAASAAGLDPKRYEGPAFEKAQREALFDEINLVGGWASLVPKGSQAVRDQVFGMAFQTIDLAGLGSSLRFAGDLDLVGSGIQTKAGGDITLLAPGGQVNVGLPGTAVANAQSLRGVVVYGQGNVSSLSQGDFQVNSQKAFVVGQGDITVWSSEGNIDAGRGANTAITVPPLVPARQSDGSIAFALPSTTVGSGIGILKPALGEARGDIGLYAPNGEVRALDALIRAPGRITLAADVVRGADNIVGGSVVGAPVATPTVSIALPSAPTSAGEAQGAVSSTTTGQRGNEARDRNSLLTVELLGLGSADSIDDCDDPRLSAEERRRRKARGEKCAP